MVGSHTILYDPTQSYHFCNPATILNFLVRWDCKIVRFYDSDRNFDNYGINDYLPPGKEIQENGN